MNIISGHYPSEHGSCEPYVTVELECPCWNTNGPGWACNICGVTMPDEATCIHCGRRIIDDPEDGWVDPLATGDDSIWRECCDQHDTFTAEHEPD